MGPEAWGWAAMIDLGTQGNETGEKWEDKRTREREGRREGEGEYFTMIRETSPPSLIPGKDTKTGKEDKKLNLSD